jgi:c-di-GMP-binding flagellar brake protein YcgR
MPDGAAFEARTLNISESGMGIVTAVNPRDGTVITITFRLPTDAADAQPMQLSAEVRNSVLSGADSGFRLGLQFVNLQKSTLQTLRNFAK